MTFDRVGRLKSMKTMRWIDFTIRYHMLPSPFAVEEHPDGQRSENPASDPDHRRRHPGRRQPEQPDRRPARAAAGPGLAAVREARPFQPRAHPRARGPRQGLGRLRHASPSPTTSRATPRPTLFAAGRQEDRGAAALLDRRRREGRGRRRARRARLRAEVLYRGRQLGPGRQQHAGLLRARSATSSPTSSTPRSATRAPTCAIRPRCGISGRCRRRACIR